MARKLSFSISSVGLIIGLVSPIFALEKVKLGSSVKMAPAFYLSPLVAEERGFWKENGLEVEWVPFGGPPAQIRAVAAGAISIGAATAADPVTAADRGLPVVIVAEFFAQPQFRVWVRADRPYRHVRDLKGGRISVAALGGATHVFGRIMFAAHGMEKEVRFVGAGGAAESLAALSAGAVDASVEGLFIWVTPYLEGKIRETGNPIEYLPKPWLGIVTFARRDYTRSKPDVVKRVLRGMVQSLEFMQKNPRWTLDKMKSFQGLSEEAAKLVYDWIGPRATGKIDRKGVENIRRVFMEYGILTEKAPAVDDLFTNEYLPG